MLISIWTQLIRQFLPEWIKFHQNGMTMYTLRVNIRHTFMGW